MKAFDDDNMSFLCSFVLQTLRQVTLLHNKSNLLHVFWRSVSSVLLRRVFHCSETGGHMDALYTGILFLIQCQENLLKPPTAGFVWLLLGFCIF